MRVPKLFIFLRADLFDSPTYNMHCCMKKVGGIKSYMNSEQLLVHGGCTNCGFDMIHMEIAKGCVQCPNCREWIRVSIKNRGYSAHPASEEEIKEATRIRGKVWIGYKDMPTNSLFR